MATLPLQNQITTLIASQGLPTLHPSFLNSILTGLSSTRQQPITAIVATVKHRLLCSDINIKNNNNNNNNILSPISSCLPTRIINNKQIEASTLNQDIFVQVLDVEDLGRSKWDQLELLEAEKRGETMKGREIIRTVVPASSFEEEQEDVSTTTNGTDSNQSQNQNKTAEKQGKGPFKLIVEDWKGTKTWALELRKVEKIDMPPAMNIGCKLWLRKGCKVARGVLLMEPTTVSIMGGKIDNRDKVWKTEREKILREALSEESS
ncbi:RecQ-mediated genome instability protein 1 [Erysiphe neolycopersici]|uniref:RecQ-mediated genome instability protein 1 n=1 Tax=Erysiphe neolycopersici TaxID=212602 RepID=A0A420HVB1_9PEZI|nr:RecQ-mediated genome instability protein 1 [Erysiphe neolycopersici]